MSSDKIEETEGKPNFSKIGRPTKTEQLEIEKELVPLFIVGIGTEMIHQKTGRAYETISKYRKKWYKRATSDIEQDFGKRQQMVKEASLVSLDKQIMELDSIKQELKQEQEWLSLKYSENGKSDSTKIPFEKRRISTRIKLVNEITKLQDIKAALEMTATVDEDIENRINKFLIKKGVIDNNTLENENFGLLDYHSGEQK